MPDINDHPLRAPRGWSSHALAHKGCAGQPRLNCRLLFPSGPGCCAACCLCTRPRVHRLTVWHRARSARRSIFGKVVSKFRSKIDIRPQDYEAEVPFKQSCAYLEQGKGFSALQNWNISIKRSRTKSGKSPDLYQIHQNQV